MSADPIAVIGSGIIGAALAVELTTRGHRVVVIDPHPPGGPHGPSYGNGAFISPASVLAMSHPGMWRRIPGYLADPLGPVTIRWPDLPRLAPWLIRFVLAGATPARWRAIAQGLQPLLGDAPARHLDLAARTGQAGMIQQKGLIYAFADRAAWQAEAPGWQIRQDLGVAMQPLDRAALQALLPDLSPRYGFGIHVTEGAHCEDPGAYVAGLLAWSRAPQRAAQATGFTAVKGRLTEVQTTAGPVPARAAIIAAGLGSARLARLVGDRIPLAAERGYHVEIPDPRAAPQIPVMPQDGKMANTLTRRGLRAAGQVELARADAPPDWRRAEILLRHLQSCFPGLGPLAPDQLRRWQGARPSTPDGLPVLSPASKIRGVYHAFGHGHVGLASAPASATVIADMIEGRLPDLDPRPWSAHRFAFGDRP